MAKIAREARKKTDLTGSARYMLGERRDVVVLDLSERGCKIFDRFSGLQKGEWIRLRLGSMGPFEAEVRWANRGYVGLRFENPMYTPILDHLAKSGRASFETCASRDGGASWRVC